MLFDEIVDLAAKLTGRRADASYVYGKYVQRLLEKGRLRRVRRGLYVALSPIEDEPFVDKLLVASKVRSEYFLGFHTALEFYGSAYSVHNDAYICVKPENRFEPFEFAGMRFKPVFVEDVDFGVEEKEYRGHALRVSSKERTFIDCLDRVEYAGGWEECLKSLQSLGGLDFEKTAELAVEYGSEALLRRVGLVLELLRGRSIFYEHLPEEVLMKLEDRISGQPRYLVVGVSGALNVRWRLYVPEGFEENLRGV